MYKDIIYNMKQRGIVFTMGLSVEEIDMIEEEYNITFPEELRLFYQEALPVSDGFYNWRDNCGENVKSIKRVMQAPVNEIINDSAAIEWNEMWGEEPIDLEERKMFIANRVLKAPKLIPIYSHRYVVSFESKELPVFSIRGSDIICFAKKLTDYFEFEFMNRKWSTFENNEACYIPFWSDLL